VKGGDSSPWHWGKADENGRKLRPHGAFIGAGE
jgi:hypothetical protein